MVMDYNVFDINLHMLNHYRRINSAKSVVNTSAPRHYFSRSKSTSRISIRSRFSSPSILSNYDRIPSRTNSNCEVRKKINDLNKNGCPVPRSSSVPLPIPSKSNRKLLAPNYVPKHSSTPALIETNTKLQNTPTESTTSLNYEETNEADQHLKLILVQDSIDGKKPVPTPRSSHSKMLTQTIKIPDFEYLQFCLRITEDIIRNDLYQPEEMKRVFNSHLEANRGRLSMTKMLHQIENISKELNISEMKSNQKQNDPFISTDIYFNPAQTIASEVVQELNEDETNDVLTNDKCELYLQANQDSGSKKMHSSSPLLIQLTPQQINRTKNDENINIPIDTDNHHLNDINRDETDPSNSSRNQSREEENTTQENVQNNVDIPTNQNIDQTLNNIQELKEMKISEKENSTNTSRVLDEINFKKNHKIRVHSAPVVTKKSTKILRKSHSLLLEAEAKLKTLMTNVSFEDISDRIKSLDSEEQSSIPTEIEIIDKNHRKSINNVSNDTIESDEFEEEKDFSNEKDLTALKNETITTKYIDNDVSMSHSLAEKIINENSLTSGINNKCIQTSISIEAIYGVNECNGRSSKSNHIENRSMYFVENNRKSPIKTDNETQTNNVLKNLVDSANNSEINLTNLSDIESPDASHVLGSSTSNAGQDSDFMTAIKKLTRKNTNALCKMLISSNETNGNQNKLMENIGENGKNETYNSSKILPIDRYKIKSTANPTENLISKRYLEWNINEIKTHSKNTSILEIDKYEIKSVEPKQHFDSIRYSKSCKTISDSDSSHIIPIKDYNCSEGEINSKSIIKYFKSDVSNKQNMKLKSIDNYVIKNTIQNPVLNHLKRYENQCLIENETDTANVKINNYELKSDLNKSKTQKIYTLPSFTSDNHFSLEKYALSYFNSNSSSDRFLSEGEIKNVTESDYETMSDSSQNMSSGSF